MKGKFGILALGLSLLAAAPAGAQVIGGVASVTQAHMS
jgi:hypothetical protein